MADIEFIQNDFGDAYVITIKNPDGTLVDLSTYTGETLNIVSKDLLTNKVTTSCTLGTNTVTWQMTSNQTSDLDGSYVAQIILTKSGNQKTTNLMSVKAHKLLTS